jgi:DNA-binding NarL/FixJ family response regulator
VSTEPADRPTIRVAVVDDHPAMREGTAALLAREPDLVVVGTGGSADEARVLLNADPPLDVLLLDVRLGEEGGLDILAEPAASRAAVVLLTAFDYPQYERVAMELGAAGFVVKSAPLPDLLAAVRRAAAGELVFRRRSPGPTTVLTDRERRVIALMAEGRSNDEIAGSLTVSTKTIEVALSRLYRRFTVSSRTELVARAIRDGWLDLPSAE